MYCAVRPDHAAVQCAWMGEESAIPMIAIINYENPTIIDAAMRMGALAMLTSPLRSTGILSSLAMAQHTHCELRELRHRIVRLQQKLLGANQISRKRGLKALLTVELRGDYSKSLSP